MAVDEGGQAALLHFDAQAEDPAVAAELANALANEIVAWDEQRATTNLERIVATLRSQIEALHTQIANLREQGDAVTEEQITGRVNPRAEQQEQLYYARTLVDSAVWLLSVQEPATAPRSPVASIPACSAGLAGGRSGRSSSTG